MAQYRTPEVGTYLKVHSSPVWDVGASSGMGTPAPFGTLGFSSYWRSGSGSVGSQGLTLLDTCCRSWHAFVAAVSVFTMMER